MVYYQIYYEIQNLFAECINFCLRLLVCFKSVLMYVKASGIFFLLLILFSKSFFSRSNQPCLCFVKTVFITFLFKKFVFHNCATLLVFIHCRRYSFYFLTFLQYDTFFNELGCFDLTWRWCCWSVAFLCKFVLWLFS